VNLDAMPVVPLVLLAAPLALLAYSYLVYPAGLRLAGLLMPRAPQRAGPGEWPTITITVPCHNERSSIAGTLESLLALDYPADRRHILVISDASTDGTDEVVRGYASRGVELVRLAARGGKTAAENAAAPHLRGEIVVNTDATIRILPGALKPLVAAFSDPTVGVASGRDISVGDVRSAGNRGESAYVDYEMAIRALETRVGSIVGASGCFYAIRASLYEAGFPEALSRDFASCLLVRERGYRSVSVDDAAALVPRSVSLRAEYTRKVRTMARGLGTLYYKRSLLNPMRYGSFSVMLFSHKLCRWLFQLSLPLAAVGALWLAASSPVPLPWLAAAGGLLVAVALVGWWWPRGRPMPRLLAVPAYGIWSNVAGVVAWGRFLRGRYQPVWEPTRR